MSWSYAPEAIPSTPLMFVRLQVGDTDSADPQLQDEEITAFLNVQAPLWAAASCAMAIAGKYARKVEKSVGRLRIASQQRQKAYADLASQLRQFAYITGGAIPYAGGLSYSDKENSASDTDAVEPMFRIDMHDWIDLTPRVGPPPSASAGGTNWSP